MDETNNVAAQSAVDDTTQTSSPQVEESTIETQTNEELATPVEVTDELPNDTEEQRKAFQTMRQELKQLKEEKDARLKTESAFAVFRQPQPTSGGINISNYIDPTTGQVDIVTYNNAVNQELQRAQQMATQTSQSVQDQLDENQARSKHPELFSNPDIEQEIADRWFSSRMRGENVSISSIADRVANRERRVVSKAEKLGAEKALTEVSAKEQVALEVQSQTSHPARTQAAVADFDQARLDTRIGVEDARVARMRSIPWANK